MGEKLTLLNQYGFETDVFDKYREAVKKTNRESIMVLSVSGILLALAMSVFGFVTNQSMEGLTYCVVLLMAAAIALVLCIRKDTPPGGVLAAGYCLCVALYIISIYGTVTMKTDAFWIGTQVAVGCYLLDYAWRVGLLQIASYVALNITWRAGGVDVTGQRLLFSIVFLFVGLVTFYTMNRTRVNLIMGREESRKAADTDLLTGLTVRIAAQ
jgi:uncharacterized membrane protein